MWDCTGGHHTYVNRGVQGRVEFSERTVTPQVDDTVISTRFGECFPPVPVGGDEKMNSKEESSLVKELSRHHSQIKLLTLGDFVTVFPPLPLIKHTI